MFIYLAYQSVHSPANVLPRYENIYANKSNSNYINDTTRRIFAGMVTCMDEGIGNITNALKKYGLFDENLIIIWTSDNGGPIPSAADGGIYISLIYLINFIFVVSICVQSCLQVLLLCFLCFCIFVFF